MCRGSLALINVSPLQSDGMRVGRYRHCSKKPNFENGFTLCTSVLTFLYRILKKKRKSILIGRYAHNNPLNSASTFLYISYRVRYTTQTYSPCKSLMIWSRDDTDYLKSYPASPTLWSPMRTMRKTQTLSTTFQSRDAKTKSTLRRPLWGNAIIQWHMLLRHNISLVPRKRTKIWSISLESSRTRH